MKEKQAKSYRANLILDLRGVETSADDILSELASSATKLGAEIVEKVNHGVQPFVRVVDRAYPEGSYVQMDVKAPATFPAAMTERVRLDRRVNRIFITLL